MVSHPERRARIAVTLLSLAGILLLILGLHLCGCKEDDEYEHTPGGYKVESYGGPSFDSGLLTKDQVFSWLDARVAEWIASHPEHDPGWLYKQARGIRFTLVDDYRISTSGSSTGFAAGLISGDKVFACIYQRAESSDYPSGAPAHTIRLQEGYWTYGVIPEGGGLQVVPHELDHSLWRPHE